MHALIATGVDGGGHREILGLDVTNSKDSAGWLAFLRGLPGASWLRCRVPYADSA